MSKFSRWLTRGRYGNVELDFTSHLNQFATQPVPLEPESVTTSALLARRQHWQDESWDMFYKFGPWGSFLDWRASAFSRIKFYIAEEPGPGHTGPPTPAIDPRVTAPLDHLTGNDPNRASDMWYRYRLHTDIIGETYLVGYQTKTGDPDTERWGFFSPHEISTDVSEVTLPDGTKVESGVSIQTGDSTWIPLPEGYSSVERMWRKDPRQGWLAFTPSRYALPILEVLSNLTGRVNAEAKSRLWTSGIMCLGEDGYLPPPPAHAMSLHDNPQVASLMYHFGLTTKNPDSAEAVVPHLMNVDKDKVGLVTLASEFSGALPETGELFLHWLAMTAAGPVEMLLGKNDDNHWSAWLANDDAVEIYLKPEAAAFASNLLEGIVRPWHKANGVKGNWIVAFDTTPLNPETEIPEDGVTGLLRELAVKGVDPALVAPYLKQMGINLDLSVGTSPPDRGIPVTLPRSDPRALNPSRGINGSRPIPSRPIRPPAINGS